MTINNFRWFLHVMLFIHTQRVIQKQKDKEQVKGNEDEDEEALILMRMTCNHVSFLFNVDL